MVSEHSGLEQLQSLDSLPGLLFESAARNIRTLKLGEQPSRWGRKSLNRWRNARLIFN